MDITAAIENARPERGESRCGIAKWLDAIPADEPGRDELIRLVETVHKRNSTDTRSAQNMSMVLTSLGLSITEGPIHEHRNHSCRCYR